MNEKAVQGMITFDYMKEAIRAHDKSGSSLEVIEVDKEMYLCIREFLVGKYVDIKINGVEKLLCYGVEIICKELN